MELFGQEYNPESFAICGSDLMIKGGDVSNIVFGNTLGTGKAKEGFKDGDGHSEEQFHYMAPNSPTSHQRIGTGALLALELGFVFHEQKAIARLRAGCSVNGTRTIAASFVDLG